jgi:hypothetical protein
MKKTISIMSEEFENEQTGEKVEGVTIMIDGILKEFLDIIRLQNPQYKDNIGIIQSALMKGLEAIKDSK